jgi:c-di-GMP-binding flagellar brake protein YcgR
MLQRMGTIWRRILNTEQAVADSLTETQEDRRQSDRYPTQEKTSVRPANSSDTKRYPAQVRNISLGGINLLVGKAFDPGQLLSIELPTADRKSTFSVLLCVVHISQVGDEQWSLGGTFARELSEEDLEAFVTGKVQPAGPDRRNRERFSSGLKATYSVVTAPDPVNHEAAVLDISATGVGLAVDRATEAGTLLSVDLMNATGQVVRTILACVVHASSWPDDRWALGCNFIRQLNEEDLKALI